MNAHQRRVWMNEKHMRLPLGSKVIYRERLATIFKHCSHSPYRCIIAFDRGLPQETTQWVAISELKPVLRLKVRPWYRDMRNKRRLTHK